MIKIGIYKIECIDEDYVLVTRNYGGGISQSAKIAEGDMESFLGGIFLQAEMTYKLLDMTTVSTHKTTFGNEITKTLKQTSS